MCVCVVQVLLNPQVTLIAVPGNKLPPLPACEAATAGKDFISAARPQATLNDDIQSADPRRKKGDVDKLKENISAGIESTDAGGSTPLYWASYKDTPHAAHCRFKPSPGCSHHLAFRGARSRGARPIAGEGRPERAQRRGAHGAHRGGHAGPALGRYGIAAAVGC